MEHNAFTMIPLTLWTDNGMCPVPLMLHLLIGVVEYVVHTYVRQRVLFSVLDVAHMVYAAVGRLQDMPDTYAWSRILHITKKSSDCDIHSLIQRLRDECSPVRAKQAQSMPFGNYSAMAIEYPREFLPNESRNLVWVERHKVYGDICFVSKGYFTVFLSIVPETTRELPFAIENTAKLDKLATLLDPCCEKSLAMFEEAIRAVMMAPAMAELRAVAPKKNPRLAQ